MPDRDAAPDPWTRRRFLGVAGSCTAHLALLAAVAPARAHALFDRASRRVVAREPWGRLEEVADGIWALISTPLQDRTTLCNGGIIAGDDATLVVEAFGSDEGARWLAERARQLTGRWPDDVVLSHYHGDHTAGVAGYLRPEGRPRLHATAATRDLVRDADARRQEPPDPARVEMLGTIAPLAASRIQVVDLGGRVLRIVPRSGHTASDLSVELDDAGVVFGGDLLWNGMFPNYMDAVPSRLAHEVRALRAAGAATFVPGHGPLAGPADLDRYLAVLDAVEHAGRAAHAAGIPAAEAAATFRLPPSLGEWMLFSPRYFEVALGAWERELGASGQGRSSG